MLFQRPVADEEPQFGKLQVDRARLMRLHVSLVMVLDVWALPLVHCENVARPRPSPILLEMGGVNYFIPSGYLT